MQSGEIIFLNELVGESVNSTSFIGKFIRLTGYYDPWRPIHQMIRILPDSRYLAVAPTSDDFFNDGIASSSVSVSESLAVDVQQVDIRGFESGCLCQFIGEIRDGQEKRVIDRHTYFVLQNERY